MEVRRDGAWLYGVHRMRRDGSSLEWHKPYKNQTALQLHHLGGCSKRAVKSYSHSFRVTCDKSAVSLPESGEQYFLIGQNFALVSCTTVTIYKLQPLQVTISLWCYANLKRSQFLCSVAHNLKRSQFLCSVAHNLKRSQFLCGIAHNLKRSQFLCGVAHNFKRSQFLCSVIHNLKKS